MTKIEVQKLIHKSIDELYQNDILFLQSNYNINERTVCHRLAMYLERNLAYNFDVDVEYNRMRNLEDSDDVGELLGKVINYEESGENGSYVYPDIIIHKRDTNINILVIEVKMSWKNRRRNIDYNKINQYINQLKYQFGVFIELNENKDESIIEFGPFLNENVL